MKIIFCEQKGVSYLYALLSLQLIFQIPASTGIEWTMGKSISMFWDLPFLKNFCW